MNPLSGEPGPRNTHVNANTICYATATQLRTRHIHGRGLTSNHNNVHLSWCRFVVCDGSEAHVYTLQGEERKRLAHITSGTRGRHRRGGFSAARYQRLHDEAEYVGCCEALA